MTPTADKLVVINVVGLTPGLLGEHAPRMTALANEGFTCPLTGVLPAVTCTAQSTMLTGLAPSGHGIVGNGWYFRDQAEVRFWLQPNALVHGEKVWETARRARPGFTCSKIFWWYNMYSSVDRSLTLRPIYPADGRKIPALYSEPPDLEQALVERLGEFPMFNFWGPASDIRSSEWIARAALEEFRMHRPDLQLVYLPHLDYNFQRLGPSDPRVRDDVAAIDRVVGELVDGVRAEGADVLIVSEYGIEDVSRPVHLNRVLREAGLLRVRDTLGWEMLDPGASRAFAVADHQLAHVYVPDPDDRVRVGRLLEGTPGVERVLDDAGKVAEGLDHARSGELVAVAEPGCWFTYYYWLDDARAPDFARTVDIHRKPGYDPVELFLDPGLSAPKLRIVRRLLQKKLGFRMLLDVIGLDASVVKGSHGRHAATPEAGPLVIGTRSSLAAASMPMAGVRDLILAHFGLAGRSRAGTGAGGARAG